MRWSAVAPLLAGALCLGAAAAEDTAPVQAALVSDVVSIQPGEPVRLGIYLRMAEGWHTYWQNPGDAGMATTVQWHLPTGFTASPIAWPRPERIVSTDLVSYGYHDDVLLVSTVEVPTSLVIGSHVPLAARVDWVACRETCVAGGADLTLELPVLSIEPGENARWVADFVEAEKQQPVVDANWHVRAAHRRPGVLLLRATRPLGLLYEPREMFFAPGEPGLIDHAAPQPWQRIEQGYELTLTPSAYAAQPPARLHGVLIAPDGWGGSGSTQALAVDVPVDTHVAW